ncbi:MAG: hypothetical protein AB8B95_08290, partial [Pseudohongiellaceae bacterium]
MFHRLLTRQQRELHPRQTVSTSILKNRAPHGCLGGHSLAPQGDAGFHRSIFNHEGAGNIT